MSARLLRRLVSKWSEAAVSIEPDRHVGWVLMFCTARPEREKLTADNHRPKSIAC
jgi:hypothetical protein